MLLGLCLIFLANRSGLILIFGLNTCFLIPFLHNFVYMLGFIEIIYCCKVLRFFFICLFLSIYIYIKYIIYVINIIV